MSEHSSNNSQHSNPQAPDEFLEPITPIEFTPLNGPIAAQAWRPSVPQIIIACLLLTFAFAAWYVLSARSVFIDVQPINAHVGIDGGMSLKIGPRYLIHSGNLDLTLQAEGYYPYDSSLEITDEQSQTYRYELTPLPGFLSLETNPPSNTTVYIDGEEIGPSPLVDIELAAGEHQLALVSERYQTIESAIDIEGRSTKQSVNFELQPNWANVEISSNPAGAILSVDGEEVGTTPLTAELLAGDRELRLKLPAHKTWTDSLQVIALEDLELPLVNLEAADGLITLQSQPNNAGVTVNGSYEGQTPLELVLSPDQNHELSFFLNGYEATTRQIQVSADEETSLMINLTPVTSSVRIVASPADAQLYVNGEFKGDANQTIDLLATNQQIEIRAEGYVTYSSDFISRPGLEQTLNVSLKTLEQQRIESIQPIITTVAGQRLRLLYPATFTMGASRREAGRQANEILREVRLTKAFYISETEVSNAQYRRFKSSHTSGVASSFTLDNNNQPVVNITWNEAALYCNWLSTQEGLEPFYQVENAQVIGSHPESTGYRLPTEAEWAWSARANGEAGNLLKFPWGDQLPPPANHGNYADLSSAPLLNRIINNYNDSYPASAPVGSFPANQHALFDMGGNVAEWVHDFYGTSSQIGETSNAANPLGPREGRYHVVRGSSWAHGSVTDLRLSFRDYSNEKRDDLGFRIARYLEE